MRIGMMVDAYKPHISGVTHAIAITKRCLEGRDHAVFVFTFGGLHYTDQEPNIVRSPGVALTRSGYSIGLGYSRPAQELLATMDLVHVHHPFLSGALALRYCKPQGIPIVFTNHTRYDLYARVYLRFMPYSLALGLLRAYLPGFYRACDMVIAPSASVSQVLRQTYRAGEVVVVPNGVDLSPFKTPGQPLARSAWGFGPNECVFVFVGRVGREKNLDFLFKAFAAVVDAAPRARLLVVGEGPDRLRLARLAARLGIAGHVHFTGQVAYSALPRYLAAADVFCTASVSEVHPLTIIEAMAAGLPVLGVRAPGLVDTVEDGLTGFLTPLELAAFSTRLVDLATDGVLRRSLGRRAAQVVETYDIERIVALLMEKYQQIVTCSLARRVQSK